MTTGDGLPSLRTGRAHYVCALLIAAAAATTPSPTPARTPQPDPPALAAPRLADFNGASPSDDTRNLADWVVDARDNRSLPFVIVDKKAAMVFAFYADGRVRGQAPALLGMAIGDDSAPGIGTRKLSAIRPAERTTPAGRFVASLDYNLHGVEILWVDYDAAISLHRVVPGTRQERRAERLASPTPLDNRVSFGCINVPPAFFDDVILPAFKGTDGIVYVLPETRSAQAVFGAYRVERRPALSAAAPPR